MIFDLSFLQTGVNLGNALDCIGGETAWKNPRTTRDMIHAYAAAGFTTLRLPVTWHLNMSELPPEYRVHPQWMARVREVVGWALSEGLYVVLNTHHDQSWIHPSLESIPEVLPRFTALWRQIATAFADCDEHLLFQGMNEPRIEFGENELGGGTPSVRAAINVLNQAFVTTVRQTGGFNATRPLCVPTYFAQYSTLCMDALIPPKDDRVIVTVHFYDPACFTFRNRADDTPYFDERAQEAIHACFETLRVYKQRWDTPIMVTEFGAERKPLPDGTSNDAERAQFARRFVTEAHAQGVPCIWWDNNYFDAGDSLFALIDRADGRILCPKIVKAIVETWGR